MLEQISPLWDVYLKFKKNNTPLVLATLVDVKGSSYKKAGAMLLIEGDLTTHGLISGGCLEADVAAHADTVFQTKQAVTLKYDLSDDSIFGLGAGCDGTITMVLQLLEGDYLPFNALDPSTDYSSSLMIQSKNDGKYPIGSYAIRTQDKLIESKPGFHHHHTQTQNKSILFKPAPKIAICGAGIDVKPLVQLLNLLHWSVTVIDNSPARLDALFTANHIKTKAVNLKKLNEDLQDLHADAVIIMTHNLNNDANYLKCFADKVTPWLGLLGPIKRRDKVIREANIDLTAIKDKLRAPVGLDLGGQMPENIAISIVAQLQQYFYIS